MATFHRQKVSRRRPPLPFPQGPGGVRGWALLPTLPGPGPQFLGCRRRDPRCPSRSPTPTILLGREAECTQSPEHREGFLSLASSRSCGREVEKKAYSPGTLRAACLCWAKGGWVLADAQGAYILSLNSSRGSGGRACLRSTVQMWKLKLRRLRELLKAVQLGRGEEAGGSGPGDF